MIPIKTVKMSKIFLRSTCRCLQELQIPFLFESNRSSRSRDMSLAVKSPHGALTVEHDFHKSVT